MLLLLLLLLLLTVLLLNRNRVGMAGARERVWMCTEERNWRWERLLARGGHNDGHSRSVRSRPRPHAAALKTLASGSRSITPDADARAAAVRWTTTDFLFVLDRA